MRTTDARDLRDRRDDPEEIGDMNDLPLKLRNMADAIRLYEGGPSTEEATALEAALAIEQQDTDAAQAERAAIVAWLRDAAKRGEIPVVAASLSLSANAIESGDHIKGKGR